MAWGMLADPVVDQACQDGFAQPTEGQAGDGDSQLYAVDHARQLLVEFEDDAGADAAGLDHLEDARFTHADQGEFGGRKEGIGGHQKQDDEHPQQHAMQSWNG